MPQDPDKEVKKEFETRLKEAVGLIFLTFTREVRQSILDGRPLPDGTASLKDFEFTFDRHYRLVQESFRSRVFREFDPIEFDGAAREYFEAEMLKWRERTATEIARIAAETNAEQARRAKTMVEAEAAESGKTLSDTEKSLLVAALLRRMFKQRASLIGETETLAAAESTKELKAEAITNTGLRERYMVLQTWNSLLDGRERETHGAADGQERASGVAFSIGSSSLLYPGDPAAPARERINCRCFLTSSIIPLN